TSCTDCCGGAVRGRGRSWVGLRGGCKHGETYINWRAYRRAGVCRDKRILSCVQHLVSRLNRNELPAFGDARRGLCAGERRKRHPMRHSFDVENRAVRTTILFLGNCPAHSADCLLPCTVKHSQKGLIPRRCFNWLP